MRFRRLLLLLMVLILVLQVPGEPAHSAPLQPTTITLNMSEPICVEAIQSNGACSIRIDSLIASGSDPSFSRLEVLVNGKLRVVMDGFFESTAYLTFPMEPGGLTVPCGRPNAGGKPGYGKAYLLTANAYMVDGTSASDSASVFCPAYDGKTYIPLARK